MDPTRVVATAGDDGGGGSRVSRWLLVVVILLAWGDDDGFVVAGFVVLSRLSDNAAPQRLLVSPPLPRRRSKRRASYYAYPSSSSALLSVAASSTPQPFGAGQSVSSSSPSPSSMASMASAAVEVDLAPPPMVEKRLEAKVRQRHHPGQVIPGIRLRTTVASDLPLVAKMLSTAAVASSSSRNNSHNNTANHYHGDVGVTGSGWWGQWKARLDQHLAQGDIESLLRGRLQALEEGRKAYRRLLVATGTTSASAHVAILGEDDSKALLRVLWAYSDRLRQSIAQASTRTGEDNVWRRHNFALPPPDTSWFYHVQITAEDIRSGQVVGFCEVAMLSNPVLFQQQQQKPSNRVNKPNYKIPENTRRDSTAVVIAARTEARGSQGRNGSSGCDDEDDVVIVAAFSPAITNLATAPEWQRRGIATRLLRFAERFVKWQWKSSQLGLYVSPNNLAALALYQNRGYRHYQSNFNDEHAPSPPPNDETTTIVNHNADKMCNDSLHDETADKHQNHPPTGVPIDHLWYMTKSL